MVQRQRTSSDGLRVFSPSKSKRLSNSLRCVVTCVIISVFLTASALLAFRTSGEVIMGAWRQHAFSPNQSRRAMLEACIADTDARRVLVTGQAGFIGMHTARQLHSQGDIVVGLDNFNDYYPVSLKRARANVLAELGIMTVEGDLNDQQLLTDMFEACNFTHVVHLAAQAGVRYAAKKPMSYVDSNVAGTVSLLEAVKKQPIMPAVVYASSSSVYGRNEKVPFSEEDRVDRPASLYAATKRADELIAHVYHNIAGMSLTGLRFFTVYGPWGRPDMAAYSFARNICFGREIRMFQGPGGMELSRDFTYIDDIVAGIVGAVDTAAPDANGRPQYRIFNLGNTHPETLSSFVDKLQAALGRDAVRRVVPLPALGDVLQTHANVTAARLAFGYEPRTSLDLGLRLFAEWFFTYYGPNGTDLRPDELQYVPL